LMFILSFLFAVAVAEAVSDWLLHSDDADNPLRQVVTLHFGTFHGTLYSIVMASAHGASWSDLSEPLETVSWWLGPVFFAYIIVINLNALNIITALYIDAVQRVQNFDRTLQQSSAALREQELVENQLKPLLKEVDKDCDGRITCGMMMRALQRKRAAKVVVDLQLDMASLKALFRLVDAEEQGSVSIEDFCNAVTHLKGNGENVHIAMLLFQSRRLLAKLDRVGKTTESRLHVLKNIVVSGTDKACCSSDIKGRRMY